MNNRKRIGFLFDLDGVLIDSEREYSRIWKLINKEFPTGVENLETVIKGCTLDKILTEFYPDEEVKEKVIDRLYQLESQMKYSYLPGAEQFLNDIIDKEYPVALVTSSNTDKMKHLYEEIPEICKKFNFIVNADLISHSKPHPEGYLLGAREIGCDIKNCIVFEDSLQGVMAGEKAGAFVVGVEGTLPKTTLQPFSDIVVKSLVGLNPDDLVKLMKNE